MSEKLLTIEEVARDLGLPQSDVEELVRKGELPAYKIGGSFLRFKKVQVDMYRETRNSAAMARNALFRDRGVKGLSPEAIKRRESWSGRGKFLKRENISSYTFWERLEDFLYYNDFYILSLILLMLVVLVVFEF